MLDMTPENKRKLTKWLIGIGAACILIFLGVQNISAVAKALSWCLGIVMPLIIGCAIALIVNVPMGFLEKQLWKKSNNELLVKARRPIAMLLAILFMVGIMIGVVAVVLPTLIDTVKIVIRSMIDMVNEFNAMSESEIAELPFGEMLLDVDWNSLLESAKSWLKSKVSIITDTVFGTITSFFGGIMDIFVSIVFAVYILMSKKRLTAQLKRIVRAWLPIKIGDWCCHAAKILIVNFKNFISAQFFEAIILGVMCFVSMLIFGFPYAAMVSVLVGITALIPVVGALIGGGVGAFLMLTVDPMKAVWFVVFFLVLQQIEGNLIYPKVMGSRVNLPGMWILAAVTVGGGIGGPVGMFVGVPLASTAYVLFKEATEKREVAVNADTPSKEQGIDKAMTDEDSVSLDEHDGVKPLENKEAVPKKVSNSTNQKKQNKKKKHR
jgi:predicted PurR-regulated permease PerM